MTLDHLATAENGVERFSSSPSYVQFVGPIGPMKHGNLSFSAHTDIGNRKTQEDRFVIVPNLVPSRNNVSLFALFDGTVGHFAADTIQKIIVRHLISTEVWNVLMNEVNRDNGDGNAIPALAVLAMSQAYSNADTELLELCRKEKNHYSSCTGITVLMIKDYTVVAHVGDSRVSLCFEERGQVSARFITTDHKPDMPNEKRRIIASGGSVQYLPTHNNKPFLRGGDFLQRKSKGEQPMQIQYSRAFGGKDLKTYGLVCEPDITVFRRGKQHRAMIIASDGLWDTFESHQAFSKAFFARSKGENPSQSLVEYALRENKFTARRSDNITAIVIFFES